MIYTIAIFDDNNQVIETIEFDAVLSFDESYSSTIPQSAVEEGYSLSDHIVKGNDKFNISGVVTDSLFRRKGAMLTYVNGRFVRLYEDTDPLPTENPVYAMKKRIKDLRENREIFGVFESLRGKNEFQTSQVNLIYPCALTDLSFSNKDGANAVYPVMAFEKVRVSKVDFQKVENPTPELIPYVKHDNAGNQSGDTGAVKIPEIDKDLAASANSGKDLVPKELKPEKTYWDKKVDRQEMEKQRLLYTNAAKESVNKNIAAGVVPYGDAEKMVNDAVEQNMARKYGVFWKGQMQ